MASGLFLFEDSELRDITKSDADTKQALAPGCLHGSKLMARCSEGIEPAAGR